MKTFGIRKKGMNNLIMDKRMTHDLCNQNRITDQLNYVLMYV